MKAISRVLSLNKNEAIFPYLDMMLSALNAKLQQIYKSPSNPEFGYYLFESISCVVSVSCKKDPSSINSIEAVLLPVFSKIVTEAGSDVYSPFVFQLLSYFLETRKSLPDGYKSLIKELINPIFWEQSGNLPALSRLVQAFLSTGADYITSSDLLVPILGVFQKLVSSKINDYLGFYIAEAIVQYNPLEKFNFALQDIFRIIFTRVQGSKTTQLVRSLLVFFSYIICFHGPKVFTDTLRQLQTNLVLMVFQNLWIPNIEQVKGRIDRKICTIAMAKVLNEWPDSRTDEFTEIRIQLGKQMQNLMEGLDSVPAPAIEEDLITDDESGKDYTSGFTNLTHVSKAEIDPFPNVDPKSIRMI
jgi:exportin-2 (importin alpha re-exporter)